MNIRIVNSPPSQKLRRKGTEYRSVRVACFYDDLVAVANDADLSTYSDDKIRPKEDLCNTKISLAFYTNRPCPVRNFWSYLGLTRLVLL